MLFKPGEHETLAAVAVNNPDNADYVTVTTPGMNTHGTSMPTMVSEATALQAEMKQQLVLAHMPDKTPAAIAWFGYDPPDTSDLSIFGAIPETRANAGAVDLASFYRGINATNIHGSDVELSAFGHSYGSTTTAQALNELGQKGVVDNAAFYGSPGLGWSNDKVLGLIPSPSWTNPTSISTRDTVSSCRRTTTRSRRGTGPEISYHHWPTPAGTGRTRTPCRWNISAPTPSPPPTGWPGRARSGIRSTRAPSRCTIQTAQLGRCCALPATTSPSSALGWPTTPGGC